MKIFILLFLAAFLFINVNGQDADSILDGFKGTWVSKSEFYDDLNGITKRLSTTIIISSEDRKLNIETINKIDSRQVVEKLTLNIDGIGETNSVLQNGVLADVSSKTRFENGVLIREIPTRQTWEINEFPVRIIERYRLSKKGDKLIIDEVYEGVKNSPVSSVVKKPLKTTITLKKKF